MGTGPKAPVLNIIREHMQKRKRDTLSLHEIILPTTDSERSREVKDKVPLESKQPAH